MKKIIATLVASTFLMSSVATAGINPVTLEESTGYVNISKLIAEEEGNSGVLHGWVWYRHTDGTLVTRSLHSLRNATDPSAEFAKYVSEYLAGQEIAQTPSILLNIQAAVIEGFSSGSVSAEELAVAQARIKFLETRFDYLNQMQKLSEEELETFGEKVAEAHQEYIGLAINYVGNIAEAREAAAVEQFAEALGSYSAAEDLYAAIQDAKALVVKHNNLIAEHNSLQEAHDLIEDKLAAADVDGLAEELADELFTSGAPYKNITDYLVTYYGFDDADAMEAFLNGEFSTVEDIKKLANIAQDTIDRFVLRIWNDAAEIKKLNDSIDAFEIKVAGLESDIDALKADINAFASAGVTIKDDNTVVLTYVTNVGGVQETKTAGTAQVVFNAGHAHGQGYTTGHVLKAANAKIDTYSTDVLWDVSANNSWTVVMNTVFDAGGNTVLDAVRDITGVASANWTTDGVTVTFGDDLITKNGGLVALSYDDLEAAKKGTEFDNSFSIPAGSSHDVLIGNIDAFDDLAKSITDKIEDALDDAYADGYEDGYAAGYSEGFADGFAAGRASN